MASINLVIKFLEQGLVGEFRYYLFKNIGIVKYVNIFFNFMKPCFFTHNIICAIIFVGVDHYGNGNRNNCIGKK